MRKVYRSFAEWPADVFTGADGTHVSTDDHENRESAEAVALMLKGHGFGGMRERFPIRTWVEEFPG